MRFMVIGRATKDSEAGKLPTTEELAAMGKYSEELAKAGVLLDATGLLPSAKGARVLFSGKRRTVIDGPFTESKELIAGFMVLECNSKEECIEWVKRWPYTSDEDTYVEIRQIFGADDFGENLTPELRARREQLDEGMANNASR